MSMDSPGKNKSCPPPGDLPNPGIEPASPALQMDFLLLSHWGAHQVLEAVVNALTVLLGMFKGGLGQLSGRAGRVS